MSTGPHDPIRLAEGAANGDLLLLSSFGLVEPGDGGVVDLDLDRHVPSAWVVGRDAGGSWWSSRVAFEQDPNGWWMATDCSTSSWDGWSEAADARTEHDWPGTGAALAVERVGGIGSGITGFVSVRGIACRRVWAVEFGWPGRTRRRILETPTGAFLLSIPVPATGLPDEPTLLRLADGRGTTIARY